MLEYPAVDGRRSVGLRWVSQRAIMTDRHRLAPSDIAVIHEETSYLKWPHMQIFDGAFFRWWSAYSSIMLFIPLLFFVTYLYIPKYELCLTIL